MKGRKARASQSAGSRPAVAPFACTTQTNPVLLPGRGISGEVQSRLRLFQCPKHGPDQAECACTLVVPREYPTRTMTLNARKRAPSKREIPPRWFQMTNWPQPGDGAELYEPANRDFLQTPKAARSARWPDACAPGLAMIGGFGAAIPPENPKSRPPSTGSSTGGK